MYGEACCSVKDVKALVTVSFGSFKMATLYKQNCVISVEVLLWEISIDSFPDITPKMGREGGKKGGRRGDVGKIT